MSLILTWSKTFFAHYTQSSEIDSYRESVTENVFACMELSKQSYQNVMLMPVKKLFDYLKWKTKLEEDKQKRIEEETKKSGKLIK